MYQETMFGSIPEVDLKMLPKLSTVRKAIAQTEGDWAALYYDMAEEDWTLARRQVACRLSCQRAIEFYLRLKGQKRHGARRK